MPIERLLKFDEPGWRMAGPGGFRMLPDGTVESYGGPGLFWYCNDVFQDFAAKRIRRALVDLCNF